MYAIIYVAQYLSNKYANKYHFYFFFFKKICVAGLFSSHSSLFITVFAFFSVKNFYSSLLFSNINIYCNNNTSNNNITVYHHKIIIMIMINNSMKACDDVVGNNK